VEAPADKVWAITPYHFRHSFVICHSTFVIASIPEFVFLKFFAKVLFSGNLNHPGQFHF